MDEPANVLDFTANGVQFSPWDTEVKDDDLTLVSITFKANPNVSFPNEGVSVQFGDEEEAPYGFLDAIFLSREKRSAVQFLFQSVWAFRVLDEGGLMQLWEASSRTPRPAFATFRVRGHAWQDESALVWVTGTDKEHFSYMVATQNECLEVVTHERPKVQILPPAAITVTETNS